MFVAVMLMTVLFSTGCTEKNSGGSDSLSADTLLADTVDSISREVDSPPMPSAADELFDDFFFNFAGSRKVQLSRVIFPLTKVENGKSSVIDKDKWQVEHFFMKQKHLHFNLSKEEL